MLDPVTSLFQTFIDAGLPLEYMDTPTKYRCDLQHVATVHEQFNTLLDNELQEKLEQLLNDQSLLSFQEQKAAFTAGLACGLQLLRFV